MEKIVKSGLRDCTVILDGSECAVKFDTCFRAFAVRNDGAADVFISKTSGIVPDADGVMCVKSGGSTVFAHNDLDKNAVYLLGTGKVMVHGQQDSNNPFRNAPTFDGGVTAEGNPVTLDGLQGGVPFSEMVISGKNLLTYPYNETTKTVNGITFTDNGDGTITANGTATANAAFMMDKNFGFEKEGNYFLSGCPSGGGLNSFFINWYQGHTGVTQKNYNDYGSGIIIPYQHIFSENNRLAIAIIAGTTVNNLVFHPQLELGDTATAYTPPITGRELTVNVSGKNLLPAMPNSVTRNGITYTVNADGSITLNGTAEKADGVDVVYKMPLKAGVYTLSGCPEGGSITSFALRAGLGTANTLYGRDYGNGLKITVDTDTVLTVTIQNAEIGRVFDNVVFRPQLEIGSAATEYEPYSGAEYTITPDTNPYIIPNDIRQQDGLNVVSVSEGEISVTGVRKNAAVKKIWDKIDELTTAIIVSGGDGETTEMLGDLSKFFVGANKSLADLIGFWIGLGEISDPRCYALIPTLTSNDGSNGTASCNSDVTFGTAESAYYSFDNNTATFIAYTGENVSGGWVMYEFNSPVCISKMTALVGTGMTTNSFDFHFEYYDNVSGAWVMFGNEMNVSGLNQGNYKNFEMVSDYVTTSKVRIISNTEKVEKTNWNVFEFQVYGYMA